MIFPAGFSQLTIFPCSFWGLGPPNLEWKKNAQTHTECTLLAKWWYTVVAQWWVSTGVTRVFSAWGRSHEGKERKGREYLYSAFSHQGTYKALRHGSHSFTCKQPHACPPPRKSLCGSDANSLFFVKYTTVVVPSRQLPGNSTIFL